MTDTFPSDLPTVVSSTRLFYRDGSSDKEYHAAINAVSGGHTVTFAYGRRGSALTTGTKTGAVVTLEAAQQIYDKLLAEKVAKGYTPDGTGAVFSTTEYTGRLSGLRPQLLNAVDTDAARRHLEEDAWCLQEKFDGKRLMVAVQAGKAEGSNRKGLFVALPQEIAGILARLPECELDGELLGECYVVFDLLRLGGTDLRERSYRERYTALASTVPSCRQVRVVETAWDTGAKQALYDRIAAAGGEGIVLKRVDARSVAGRPASGGAQVKCKFYATCTCLVAARNDQRSVRLSLLDETGSRVDVGNVTIPGNKAIPQVGALVEIRYLYAYKGGSLYQPAFLGERDDLSTDDCLLGQIKYKSMGDTAEED